MTDEVFLTAFESGRLPKAEWTHVAHVRMAWLVLSRWPYPQALERIRTGIRRHNASVGTPADAYHETITVAFARIINDRLAVAPANEALTAFQERNLDLFDRTMSTLLRHYRRETLFSAAARQRFVEPDLEALPGGN